LFDQTLVLCNLLFDSELEVRIDPDLDEPISRYVSDLVGFLQRVNIQTVLD